MRDVLTITTELESALADYRSSADIDPALVLNQKSETIKALREELNAVLTEGANPCKICGNMPHGIKQPRIVDGTPVYIYEVGCLVCRDHRSKGTTIEQAVKNWNDMIYIKPEEALAYEKSVGYVRE